MKKIFASFVLLLASFCVSSTAFADYPNFFTSDQESGSLVDTFTADQDIWLYIQLPASGLSFTSYWTTDPTAGSWLSYTTPTTEASSWYKLNDLSFYDKDGNEYGWDEIVQNGVWNIAGTYSYAIGKPAEGTLSTSFTINAVPEPISAGLFLIGGAALAVVRRKKA